MLATLYFESQDISEEQIMHRLNKLAYVHEEGTDIDPRQLDHELRTMLTTDPTLHEMDRCHDAFWRLANFIEDRRLEDRFKLDG